MGISRLGACASYLFIYLSLLIKQSEACWWRYRWDFLLIFFSYVLCIFLVASTTSQTVILWKQNDSLWVTHTVTHDAQNWFMEDENRFTQNTGHFVLNIEFIWPDGFILPIARVIYSHDWFRNNGLRGLHHAFSRETSFSTNNDGDAKDDVSLKNRFIFYRPISQWSWSVQYAGLKTFSTWSIHVVVVHA